MPGYNFGGERAHQMQALLADVRAENRRRVPCPRCGLALLPEAQASHDALHHNEAATAAEPSPDERIEPVKNKLTDLNNHLFAQLERLSDEELTPEQIESEVKRADAIVSIADSIVRGADMTLRACKLVADHGDRFAPQLKMIAGSGE